MSGGVCLLSLVRASIASNPILAIARREERAGCSGGIVSTGARVLETSGAATVSQNVLSIPGYR